MLNLLTTKLIRDVELLKLETVLINFNGMEIAQIKIFSFGIKSLLLTNNLFNIKIKMMEYFL